MQALLASLAVSAAKAREKREAIDRYKYRKSAYGSYRRRIDDSLGKFDDVTEDIGEVKALAGPKGRRLSKVEKRVSAIEVSLLPVTPPVELGPAHDLLVSSARLMREALRLQRGATSSGDAAATQNASAAAAGALLLLETARTPHRRVLPKACRPVIAPRATRLVRVPDLASFRQVILDRALEGTMADVRGRAIHRALSRGRGAAAPDH